MISNSILTVCIITYNHEDFIANALESVFKQITDFDFQIVIADDFSTDNTRDILEKYKSIYSDKITLIFQKENVGAAKNWIDLLKYPKSKYIAYLEGDDFWTDPYKLQKQVNYLEINRDCNLCFHNSSVFIDNKIEFNYTNTNKKKIIFEDLISPHFIATSSIIFKNNIEFPNWVFKIKSGDKVLLFLSSIMGKIGYINEVMSVYRIHRNGMSQTDDHKGILKVYNMFELYYHLNEYTNFQYHDKFISGLYSEINEHIISKLTKNEPSFKEIITLVLRKIKRKIYIK